MSPLGGKISAEGRSVYESDRRAVRPADHCAFKVSGGCWGVGRAGRGRLWAPATRKSCLRALPRSPAVPRCFALSRRLWRRAVIDWRHATALTQRQTTRTRSSAIGLCCSANSAEPAFAVADFAIAGGISQRSLSSPDLRREALDFVRRIGPSRRDRSAATSTRPSAEISARLDRIRHPGLDRTRRPDLAWRGWSFKRRPCAERIENPRWLHSKSQRRRGTVPASSHQDVITL